MKRKVRRYSHRQNKKRGCELFLFGQIAGLRYMRKVMDLWAAKVDGLKDGNGQCEERYA